jgi:hypothetical protein
MRTFLMAGLLAMAVGCGGSMVQEEEPDLTSQEAPLPDCSTNTIVTTYYSDAGKSSVIGERGCDCGFWISWGRTSSFYDRYNSC